MTIIAVAIPLSSVAMANHGARTLEVTPETDTNPAGTTHTLTATVTPAPDSASGPVEVDFEIESGPATRVNCTGAEGAECTGGTTNNDGNTPESPDMTCTVEVGSTTCQVSFTSEGTGTNVIRAWIDHDKRDSTVEADRTEGHTADECSDDELPPDQQPDDCALPVRPVDNSEPGGTAEPDSTDVVTKTWVAAAAAILNCEPETAINPTTGEGSTERYTCTVTDRYGNPIEGAHVDGENLNGANDPDSSPGNPNPGGGIPDYDHQTAEGGHFCTTGADGTCSDTVEPVDGETGTALICFFASETATGTYDPSSTDQGQGGDCDTESLDHTDNDMTDVVQKTWEARRANAVDAEPETDTNDVGQNHTITATVYDQFGAEFSASSTRVNFEFFAGSPGDTDGNSDTSTPDRTCTTNDSSTSSDSSCSITYTATREGTDTVCVYVGTPPSSDANSRTCGGEGLTESEDDPAAADPPERGTNQSVDVVEKNWVEPQPGLDCEPEQDTNPQRSSHTVTCRARNAQGEPEGGTRIHAEATGANDPDNSDSPQSPDFTCTTPQDDPLTPTQNESRTCSFTHGPGESTAEPGTTTYRVWIDEDKDASTFDGDAAEGPNAGDPRNPSENEAGATGTIQPGNDPEPDNTDVVQKTWVPAPATLTMVPESDQAKVGTCNPYTITVRDIDGQPAQGAIIDVEQRHQRSGVSPSGDEPRVLFCTPTAQQGANPSSVDTSRGDLSPPEESPDDPGTLGGETTQPTDANGQVTIGIAIQPANGSDGSGNVTITAFYDQENNNDDPDQNEPQDTSTKTWIPSEARNIVCSPRQASNPTGSSHTVTCTVTDFEGAPAQGEAVVFSEDGPGRFTSSTTDETDQNGQVTATTTSDLAGEQRITATIASDTGANEPDDVDECDRAASDPQGAPAGNCSDTVTKTWVGSTARSIDCTPKTGTNDTGEPHVVTCTVLNASGQPASGEGVTFTESGPGTVSPTQATTNQSGQAQTTATSSEGGTQRITGTITVATQNEPDTDECDRAANDPQGATAGKCADTVEKTWVGAEPPPPECSDGVDNDGDGRIDYPDDPGCDSASDDDESDGPQQEFGGERGQPVDSGPCAGFTTGSVNARAGGGFVIVGTNGADALQGSEEGDLICGLGGADTINGAGGDDTIYGNRGRDGINGDSGNDSLFGNLGKDIMIGGEGRDTLRGGAQNDNMSGGAGNDTLLGQGGWDTLKGNAGNDTFVGAGGNDIIQGGGGNDVARGNQGDDVLKGFSGADTLRGGGGNDIIRGSAGNDTLRGGKGDDVLNGGGGTDSCRGGAGNDFIRRCE